MAALRSRCGHYIFALWFLSIFLRFFPHLISAVGDWMSSLGYPCKFQRASRLGNVTARHCSSGRQPNFAALNRGHHLYSAGQPSRWALAHSLVTNCTAWWQRHVCANNLPRLATWKSKSWELNMQLSNLQSVPYTAISETEKKSFTKKQGINIQRRN